MTLSETREQIGKLDAHLTELKAEKHQLFLQLKKVLNEDDVRRRQLLLKESRYLLLTPIMLKYRTGIIVMAYIYLLVS